MIEAFHSALRKVTNRKTTSPNDISVLKILFLGTMDIMEKWTMPVRDWSLIRGQMDIVIPDWEAIQVPYFGVYTKHLTLPIL